MMATSILTVSSFQEKDLFDCRRFCRRHRRHRRRSPLLLSLSLSHFTSLSLSLPVLRAALRFSHTS